MSTNGNEPKISVAEGHGTVNKCVGILFTGIEEEQRENMIAGIFRMTVTTGCGQKYHYNFNDFPREDVKCKCGKNCWVVKYE